MGDAGRTTKVDADLLLDLYWISEGTSFLSTFWIRWHKEQTYIIIAELACQICKNITASIYSIFCGGQKYLKILRGEMQKNL